MITLNIISVLEINKSELLKMENIQMNENQFSATILWNKLVQLFQSKMSCKTHRKGIKVYDNCFVASEAITIVHEILRQHVKKDASRKQAKKLLQKFLLLRVIEDVKGRNGLETLSDNKQLYR